MEWGKKKKRAKIKSHNERILQGYAKRQIIHLFKAHQASQATISLADERLPASADAGVILAQTLGTLFPVLSGELEFLQHERDESLVVFWGPFGRTETVHGSSRRLDDAEMVVRRVVVGGEVPVFFFFFLMPFFFLDGWKD